MVSGEGDRERLSFDSQGCLNPSGKALSELTCFLGVVFQFAILL